MDGIKRIVIALRLDISPGREQLTGILRYIKQHGKDWDIQLRTREQLEGYPSNSLLSRADGIIASESQSEGITDYLATHNIPTVLIDAPKSLYRKRTHNITLVSLDNRSIGEMGVRHFMSRGRPTAFAFVTDKGRRPWAVQRAESFAKEVSKCHMPCRIFDDPDLKGFHDWLQRQPKPVAIMTACDRRLNDILECCRESKLKIPEQVLILGVDNDEMYCSHSSPTMSSIDPGLEHEGFIAATKLSRILSARRPLPKSSTLLQPVCIYERESTSRILPAAALIAKGMAFIDGNASRPIGVSDVVDAMGVSRRLAELRFRQLKEMSISDAIANRRLKLLTRKIKDSDCNVSELIKSCGFTNRRQLERLFKRKNGMSVLQWRKLMPTDPKRSNAYH